MMGFRKLIASIALLGVVPASGSLAAELRHDKQVGYEIALAGINVGDLALDMRRNGDAYDVRAEGSYRVLFWSGTLSGMVVGKVAPAGVRPSRYEVSTQNDTPSTTVIEFETSLGPTSWQRIPEAPAEWTEGRIALQRDHLRPALDPVSAIVASALELSGGSAPEVCDRAVRIFTGFSVFELEFDGVRESEDSRVFCTVTYRALSGHRANSRGVERLSQPGEIEIAFDRLPGGYWFPGRIALPTGIGTLTIDRI